MAEPVLDGLGVGAELDEERRAGVAEIVGAYGKGEADLGEGGEHHPLAKAVAVEAVCRIGTVTMNLYGHLFPSLEAHLADALDELGRRAIAGRCLLGP